MKRSSLGILLWCVLWFGCNGPKAVQTPSSGAEQQQIAPPPLSRAGLARAIHDRVNLVRLEEGLSQLAWNDTLAMIATVHSDDMAANDYFEHINREGASPTDRGRAADYECVQHEGSRIYEGIGENLFQTFHYDSYTTISDPLGTRVEYEWKTLPELAEEAVQGWLNSPPHRKNLLNARYRTHGIGVGISKDLGLYVTQNFC